MGIAINRKKENKYQPNWSWKEQQELYKGGGG
jgi:hypothetical protein